MRFSSTWIVFLLHFITTLCFALPIENSRNKEAGNIQEDILLVEVDRLKPEPSLRIRPRQEDGGDGDGGTDAAEGIAGLGPEAIGNNVIKVVTSALTGNVNGIFDGSFNLFGTGGTRNQVEGFFNSLVGGLVNGIIGSTTANPNKATSGGGGGNTNVAAAPAALQATTARSGSQYVILLNQGNGAIRGATLLNQQARTQKPATPAPAATTKKADDDDEEENEERRRRSMADLI